MLLEGFVIESINNNAFDLHYPMPNLNYYKIYNLHFYDYWY